MSNILKRADKIINQRAEEKERQYGPMDDTMQLAADIYNVILPARYKKIVACQENVYYMMLAMKFAREHYAHKEDNLLDICAYIGALNNKLEKDE